MNSTTHLILERATITEQELLQCFQLVIPVGVLGYYSWLSDLINISFNVASSISHARNGSSFSIWSLLHGLATAAKSIYALYTTGVAVDQCLHGARLRDLPGGPGGPFMMFFWLRSASGGVLTVAAFLVATGWKGMGFFVIPAFSIVYLTAYVFYTPATIFTRLTMSDVRPVMTVSIPLLIVLVLLVFVGCAVGELRIVLLLVAFVVPFHLWAVGAGHVIFGDYTGDPWGSYVLRDKFGKIEAALTGVTPVISF